MFDFHFVENVGGFFGLLRNDLFDIRFLFYYYLFFFKFFFFLNRLFYFFFYFFLLNDRRRRLFFHHHDFAQPFPYHLMRVNNLFIFFLFFKRTARDFFFRII